MARGAKDGLNIIICGSKAFRAASRAPVPGGGFWMSRLTLRQQGMIHAQRKRTPRHGVEVRSDRDPLQVPGLDPGRDRPSFRQRPAVVAGRGRPRPGHQVCAL